MTLLCHLLPRETLSDLLCGQLVTRWRVPSGWASVLRALVSHLGQHSNRVWAGVDCLAADGSVSASTVKRALRFFRDTLKIRVVSGPDLAGGPGPHQFTGEKRGDNDTACYDLSSLIRFIPAFLVRRFASSTMTSQPPASSNPCPVIVEEKETRIRPDGKGTAAAAAAAAAPAAFRAGTFLRSNLTDRKEEGICEKGRGYRALRERGVWPAVAAAIVRDKGDDWARRLAVYARWQEKPVGAGWIQRTWKSFDGWPDWFTEKWNREEAAASRVVRAPVLFVPPAPHNGREEGPPAPNNGGVALALANVTPPLWGAGGPDVLARALAAVLASPLAPPVRRAIEKRGIEHPHVQAEARRSLQQRSGE